jgi:hypothetical protein
MGETPGRPLPSPCCDVCLCAAAGSGRLPRTSSASDLPCCGTIVELGRLSNVGVGVVAESDWSGEDMVVLRHVVDLRWPRSTNRCEGDAGVDAG